MARAEKPAGSGSKARRAARRNAKFNPKPSSAGGAALVNVGDASQYDEEHAAANEAGKKNRAQAGKKLGKRKKGESGDDDGASGAKERGGKKSHKTVDSSSKSHATEKVDFSKLSRKEAKVKSDEMKALRKPNFA